MSCTKTNWDFSSGSPDRGVQMSEANLGPNNLSIVYDPACFATSVQRKKYMITNTNRQTRGALPHTRILILLLLLYGLHGVHETKIKSVHIITDHTHSNTVPFLTTN